MAEGTRPLIDDFLAQKRLAFIGVSRDPKDYSRSLFTEFCRRKYITFPVNPHAAEIDGAVPFAHVQDIPGGVDGALLIVPPNALESVLQDCLHAGVPRLWLRNNVDKDSPASRTLAEFSSRGGQVIAGYCPFMFLPETASFHSFHAFILKLFGGYPR